MKTPFYACGFFFHSPTRQILLLRSADAETPAFTMIRGKGNPGEIPQDVFLRSVKRHLNITVDPDDVLPVYDYEHESMGYQYVFYVEIPPEAAPPQYSEDTVRWLPLAAISKANMSGQTLHDIVIGERVIRANEVSRPQGIRSRTN